MKSDKEERERVKRDFVRFEQGSTQRKDKTGINPLVLTLVID